MRYLPWAVACLCAAAAVRADGTATGVQWPGWRVMTSQMRDRPSYPMTHMLDGNPATAWVHPARAPGEGVSAHCVGTCIRIARDHFPAAGAFTIDGIGIINGYAKSPGIYRRNNRISRITLIGYGRKTALKHTATLRETLALQRISFPAITLSHELGIRIDEVTVGPDDDLCIAELVLFSKGRALPWKLTPRVLFNVSNGCGCGGGPAFEVRRLDGRVVSLPGGAHAFLGVARQPGAARYLLCTEHRAYVYDLRTGRTGLTRALPGRCASLGWTDTTHALVVSRDTRGAHWYRLALPGRTWRAIAAPRVAPTFLPGAQQPNYGA